MDDTIAMLNTRSQSTSGAVTSSDPVISMGEQRSLNDTVNISIISHDESTKEDTFIDERPVS